MRKQLSVLLAAILFPFAAFAQNPPLMGWSSWNTYGFQINDSVIKAQADAMVELGFHNKGYNHINIDDGFFGGRDKDGNLLIHPTRFPNGLRPLVDYIHSKGLKAGIYSDAGANTCASYWGNPKDTIGIGVGLSMILLVEHSHYHCREVATLSMGKRLSSNKDEYLNTIF